MKLSATLHGKRHLPEWWTRFTDAFPIVPNLFAISGLFWICYSLAPVYYAPAEQKYGVMVQALRAATTSDLLAEKFIHVREVYHNWVPEDLRKWAFNLYGDPTLYLIVPFLLLLEFLFPCKKNQPLIGKGFLQDAVWFVATIPTRLIILGVFSSLLGTFYDSYLSFLTIKSAANWPLYIQVLAALLVTEFLTWFSHFVRHKLYFFWVFHAVHHSQQEMNAFTNDRNHVADKILAFLLMFIPFYMFTVPHLYAVAVVGLFVSIHNRFVHANVSINLGWLGYFFTSPQFHRVHHSIEKEHQDKNFGTTLSVFDYLLGTAHSSRFDYPDTGIEDARFPDEHKFQIWRIPGNWVAQTIYPFAQLFRKRRPAPTPPTTKESGDAVLQTQEVLRNKV